MPFTPLHMGPALALKGVTGRYFSVLVFGIAQVAMDIEPLIGLIRGADILHGYSHTYLGATLIAMLVMCFARPLCRTILRLWNQELSYHGLSSLRSPADISWLAVTTGAFVGTYSHIVLDLFMHTEMKPLAPWSNRGNALHGVISIEHLHYLCIGAGLVGIVVWLAQGMAKRLTAQPKTSPSNANAR